LLRNEEDETAMYAERILDFGYPKFHDGKNVVFELQSMLDVGAVCSPAEAGVVTGFLLGQKFRCRVARGSCPPRALSRSGQGDFHHPAPPWRWLVVMSPRSGP
jgi:hypothetical protein